MKYEILRILNERKGEYVSGQAIADELGISRVSVSKQVKRLKEDGFEILSQTRRGYQLTMNNDVLNAAIIEDGLDPFYHVQVVNSVDSTNNELKRNANDLPDGFVLAANEQTAGRGRNGHDFHSPSQNGIYFSMFLKPDLPINQALKVTACSSMAVVDAIEKNYGIKPRVKWVNDVLIGQKKVCGILCEGSVEMNLAKLEYIIVGIGINVHSYSMPEEIRSIAGCIEDFSDRRVDRNLFLRDVLNAFLKYYRTIDKNTFLPRYKEYSCLLGKEINVIEPHCTYAAKAVDINDRANLVIETSDGTRKVLSSGEIHIREKAQ
ncbi:biotin--[acetyl-CoA-carboxylase] ligase [Catenisphaera adipataccumulans]|jgi:BirA family biotin operon repressor/biotin-[acetyl-CoA-carboxylase] ligase|uniref:Bifunctional ligase/repressor BirA n=1 Tax=Catenisphaera adipataccumulans TaxID=700500 RepID=A0A7W8D069_9FIRM|nr:biotin--[acetyl-CoA-carboxylase] ligase [Catenisphaera adipataccumulans]MBB5183574.1 BirA family biotin operon repressor/biotin-[acetyl-CoA-carboxylase] ligase [Catenisphaera adipataccumulans]